MGSILNSLKNITKNTSTANASANSINQLSLSEIEFVLALIKSSNFKGEHVELVYGTAVKLQNQYLIQQQPKS